MTWAEEDIVGIHNVVLATEDTEQLACAVVRSRVHELVTEL
jgi:hypothetical protein